MNALKHALRRSLKVRRAQIQTAWRTRAVLTRARHLVPADARCIGLYNAFGSELDPAPLMIQLQMTGRYQVAVPVVVAADTPLQFRELTRNTPLRQSPLGIWEPVEQAGQCWPDVMFVPVLGMDRRGYRLGYGGGFYDRTLAGWAATGHKQPLTIGLAFEAQVVHRLPSARHDIPLNMLVTEAGCRRFR